MKPRRTKKKEEVHTMLRSALIALLALSILGAGTAAFFVYQGKKYAETEVSTEQESTTDETFQFPVSVDPTRKLIVENPSVDAYFEVHIAERRTEGRQTSWLRRALGKLALRNWYQNLASLSSRMLVILSGERKEEVAQHFGTILGWNEDDKKKFIELISRSAPELAEGKFFPGTYTVAKESTPEDVAQLVLGSFSEEVLHRYDEEVAALVPLQDALTIASILEREAYDFEDMRFISGIIWNRLFVGMPLQIDATLQYAKGSRPHEPWWPRVFPRDKFIDSLYNTYKHEGLPPAPIANPSLDAILAALNPRSTDCMYYFHDRDAVFHCAATYKDHVALLRQYYGRGK